RSSPRPARAGVARSSGGVAELRSPSWGTMADLKGADDSTDREFPTQAFNIREATSGLRLVVVSGTLLSTHALPQLGALAIGRAPEVQIYVPHPSVSRRHATL